MGKTDRPKVLKGKREDKKKKEEEKKTQPPSPISRKSCFKTKRGSTRQINDFLRFTDPKEMSNSLLHVERK